MQEFVADTTIDMHPNAAAAPARPSFADQIKIRVALLGGFVGSIWLAFFLDAALPVLHLERHGVIPRTFGGLQGILFAPWIHANLWHLTANTGGLLVLGWLAMWPRVAHFWQATAGGMIGAGLCAWVLGAPYTDHIGASGVVFGYAGYLIGRGLYARNITAILVAIFVSGSYGLSMLYGVLPITPGISWQSHLGGIVGGFLTARVFSGKPATGMQR